MIAASVVGAWFGAGIVAGWPRRKIQIGMGVLLIVAAAIMVVRQLGTVPGGGAALGLEGGRLAIAIGGNLILGALMTLGIGLFAPCMILVALLGMNQTTAFPIMMGSCAFLMPFGSVRFLEPGPLQPARRRRADPGWTARGAHRRVHRQDSCRWPGSNGSSSASSSTLRSPCCAPQPREPKR